MWLWLLALVTGDRLQVTGDIKHATCDTHHLTCDMGHVTRDTIRTHQEIQCLPYVGFLGETT